MSSIHRKHQIVESLDDMDQAQMEKVLSYIKGILSAEEAKVKAYQRFKNQALHQIRQALNSNR